MFTIFKITYILKIVPGLLQAFPPVVSK